MKRIKLYLVMSLLLMAGSCGGPDLVLMNIVNRDGSLTRRVTMTWDKDEFDLNDCHVPVDSTWSIERSMKLTDSNDTVYTLVAEKHFESVDQVNSDYQNYRGYNPNLKRRAEFSRQFRWFNTVYYYAEVVEGAIDGYPPEDFMNEAEMHLFYMPEEIVETLLEGPDSTHYSVLYDSKESKKDMWILRSLVKDVIGSIVNFSRSGEYAAIDTNRIMMAEVKVAEAIDEVDGDERDLIDHVMGKGFYEANSALLDTALAVAESDFSVALDAKRYVVQTAMPGRVISTNGYVDNQGTLNWEVNGDVILSSDYVMWARSGTTNWWAWVITGMFLLFVVTGLVVRRG